MQRTQNAIRNIIWGFVNKFVILLFPFVIRTIIIKTLGSQYLGLNSLFISILQVLNLTELGINSAIVFSMYKPIAEKDTETISALMNLYKKIYRIIGVVILIAGIIVTPFLKNFIKGTYPENINIYFLYLIYLFNTVITYLLFAYKSALLTATQRNDIISNVGTITNLLQYTIQIIVLCVLKNYYIYIMVSVITTIINNLVCAYVTDKKYPEFSRPKGKVKKEITDDIKKRVKGLMIQRVCATTRNSLDSIFISAYIGLNAVAMYNNYYTIINAIIGIMGIFSTAITAGIGNSIITESKEKNYKDMNKFNYIYMWMSGWCTICLLCLFQPFMTIWMGKEYLFSFDIVILFCIYFYSLRMGVIRGAYSDAKGLWWENRNRAILETIANIALNWLLVGRLGIRGVILGTLISLLVINFGYGSQILFKYYFTDQKVTDYFKRNIVYAVVTLIIAIVTHYICININGTGILELMIKGSICVIIPNILYILIYRRTKMFKEAKEFVLNNILRK